MIGQVNCPFVALTFVYYTIVMPADDDPTLPDGFDAEYESLLACAFPKAAPGISITAMNFYSFIQ